MGFEPGHVDRTAPETWWPTESLFAQLSRAASRAVSGLLQRWWPADGRVRMSSVSADWLLRHSVETDKQGDRL